MLAKEDIQREWEQGLLAAPSANIYESAEEFILVLSMPGVTKESVEVKLSNGEMMIYGRAESTPPDHQCLLKEIDEGNFYRVFQVDDSIDETQIKAKMEAGVLSINMPKHERVKPRDIPIEIS